MLTQHSDKRRVKKLLLVQLVVMMVVSAGFRLLDANASLSAGIGGVASLLPNAMFALWVFAPYRAQQANELVGRFYMAELAKLLLTIVIFIAVFVWYKSVNVTALFVAYFLVQVLSPILAHKITA